MAEEIGPEPRLDEPVKPRGFGVKLPARPRQGRREHTTHHRPDRGGGRRVQNVKLTGAVPVGIGDAGRVGQHTALA
jgi:hypothetical protein